MRHKNSGSHGRTVHNQRVVLPPADASWSVAALLEQLCRASTALRDRTADQLGLHASDYAAVLALHESSDPMTSTQLAATLGLSPSGATCLVDRLSRSGHLKRQPHPYDRRKVLISCTPTGHAAAHDFHTALAAAVSRAAADLDATSRRHTHDVYSRLTDTLATVVVDQHPR